MYLNVHFGHTSLEFQTRNYITCFGHICNHPRGQEFWACFEPFWKCTFYLTNLLQISLKNRIGETECKGRF